MARQKVKGISISSANATGSANATSGYVLKADGSGGAAWGADSTVGGTPSFTAATISASDPVLNIARTGNYTYKIGSLANDTFAIQSNETGDASYESLIEIDSYAHQGSGPALKIDNNGNVGIGAATTPNFQVHIKKTGTAEIELEGTVAAELNLHDSGGTTNQRRARLTQNGTLLKLQALNDADDTVTYDFIAMNCSDGNVGIGETSPEGKLHVKGGASGSSYTADGADKFILEHSDSVAIDIRSPSNKQGLIMFSDGTRAQGLIGYDHSEDSIRFSNSGNLERMRIASDGHTFINNGIGVATRTTMVNQGHNWQGSTYNTLSVGGMAIGTDSSNSSHVWFNMYDTGSKYSVDTGYAMDHYHTNSNGEYVWRSFTHAGSAGASITPTQVFKMDRLGKVGYQKVDPAGDMTIHTGAANGTTTKWRWGSNVSNTHSYWINHNNAGVYMSSGGTSWTAHSDERIKENITDIGSVMDKIKDYRCVTYNRKGMSDTKVGFIAQDWETDFPHVVDEDTGFTIQSDGSLMPVHEEENTSEVKPKSISYTETIPILLKAIQELEARIKVLEG